MERGGGGGRRVCGRCKQWISGDSLGLDREKIKR